jgi:hypothetical protein
LWQRRRRRNHWGEGRVPRLLGRVIGLTRVSRRPKFDSVPSAGLITLAAWGDFSETEESRGVGMVMGLVLLRELIAQLFTLGKERS